MELEQMKTLWEEMSAKVEKQELVTNQLIMEMTQQKYKNKFSKLLIYEYAGAVICIGMGLFLLFNIQTLDTWYLLVCGIFSISFLLILPFLSLGVLKRMTNLTVSKHSFKETLVRFKKTRDQVLLIQRSGIVLTVLFMLTSVPVMSKVLNNKDFFLQDHGIGFWIFMGVTTIALLVFARWAYGCYKNVTNSAEQILLEIDDLK